jgi:hypothetical protein
VALFVYSGPMADAISTWTWPLRGKGSLLLLAGWLAITLSIGLASLGIPLVPAAVATLATIYLTAFMYLIVRDTARGADSLSSWPGLPVREDFFVPVARVVAGALWSCLPALVYRLVTGQADLIFWLLFLLAGYLLPMVLVRVSTRESFLAGHPVAVLVSIIRTVRVYTGICIPYYFAVLGGAIATTVLVPREMWVIAGVVDAVSLFLLLVVLYRLGLFHREYASRLRIGPLPGLGAADTEPSPGSETEPPSEPAGEPGSPGAVPAPSSDTPAETDPTS